MKIDTLPEIYRPLMGRPDVLLSHCAICGRAKPLNQHHVVRRGAGKAYNEEDIELRKPTITLCGFGNHGADADGHLYCHGLAHTNRLHFRWNDKTGWYEYIKLDCPTDYLTALGRDGWKVLPKPKGVRV